MICYRIYFLSKRTFLGRLGSILRYYSACLARAFNTVAIGHLDVPRWWLESCYPPWSCRNLLQESTCRWRCCRFGAFCWIYRRFKRERSNECIAPGWFWRLSSYQGPRFSEEVSSFEILRLYVPIRRFRSSCMEFWKVAGSSILIRSVWAHRRLSRSWRHSWPIDCIGIKEIVHYALWLYVDGHT